MNEIPLTPAKAAGTVFLVPGDYSAHEEPLRAIAADAPKELQVIITAFLDSLKGVIRTLSIPFQYTFSQIHSLHWQRIYMAERIRARSRSDSAEDDTEEVQALSNAKQKFDEYLKGDGRQPMADDVVERLLWLKEDPDSLSAARQLTRQGVVLAWSALEVLSRDAFVYLLNRRPHLVEVLLSDNTSKKYFSAERVDWPTLAAYGYNLSSNVGTYLSTKTEIKNVPAIKAVYLALFPNNQQLRSSLSDRRIWELSQRRHLLVHSGGIVDQAYREATGSDLPVGASIVVSPQEIESILEATYLVGTEIVREVSNAA